MINPLPRVEVNRFILSHPMVPEGLEGALIGHLTDIHMGKWVRPQHLRQLVDFVNQQSCDIVTLTGDYVGYSKRDLAPCINELAGLSAPTYAVLGNHDHWTSTELARRAFETSAITLLENQHQVVRVQGADLLVVGVDDAVTKNADIEQAFSNIRRDLFCVVLNHVPSIAFDCIEAGGHFVLSGHTHGFQFNIPKITHPLAEKMGTRLFAGPYILEDAILYISRGIGSASWPRRIRAEPEISFFTLRNAEQPDLEWLGDEIMHVEK